jgi:hypothetical protein
MEKIGSFNIVTPRLNGDSLFVELEWDASPDKCGDTATFRTPLNVVPTETPDALNAFLCKGFKLGRGNACTKFEFTKALALNSQKIT